MAILVVHANIFIIAVAQVYFSLERRPRLLVIKLFIPSFMLLAIGYVTLYIPRDLLQVR